MGSLSPVNLSTNILKKVLDELVNSTELDHLFEYHVFVRRAERTCSYTVGAIQSRRQDRM